MKRFFRVFLALLAAYPPLILAGEIAALVLDLPRAGLVGMIAALGVGAALAAIRPRGLRPVGLAAAILIAALLTLRPGRLAARWGIAGYHALLALLFACAIAALGAALSLLPRAAQSSRSRS